MLPKLKLSHFLPRLMKSPRYSTLIMTDKEISPILTNRNPRNLEKLRIGYKPDGFHVDRKGRSFWNKLKLSVTGRYITASIIHFKNGEVLKASTKEWALQKQLFSQTDHSAYVNLARLLARRCLESGITEVHCDLRTENEQGKLAGFLQTLKESGLILEEPPQFKPDRPWDLNRVEKPWEVNE